jgi:hypothetical protein
MTYASTDCSWVELSAAVNNVVRFLERKVAGAALNPPGSGAAPVSIGVDLAPKELSAAGALLGEGQPTPADLSAEPYETAETESD